MERGKCNSCEYRRSGCGYPSTWETNKCCKKWKVGKCYFCKYYKNKMTEEETDAWYERGCEGYFPCGADCKQFKRSWRMTIFAFLLGWWYTP